MGRLTTLVRRRLQRHNPAPDPVFGHGADPAHHNDPTGTPADGYPHHYYPVGHPATTGEPNRGDELLFIDTEIARADAAGILDEGNYHLLDDVIEHRRRQWRTAIDSATQRRHHLADGLIATATYYHQLSRHDLATTRLALAHAEHEDTHWRHHLTGLTPTINTTPITIPPAKNQTLTYSSHEPSTATNSSTD